MFDNELLVDLDHSSHAWKAKYPQQFPFQLWMYATILSPWANDISPHDLPADDGGARIARAAPDAHYRHLHCISRANASLGVTSHNAQTKTSGYNTTASYAP
jgi:hypothetical protein